MSKQGKAIVKWVMGFALLTGAVGFVLYRRGRSEEPVVWKTTKVTKGSVEQVVTATGQVNAVVTVQVGSQVSGTIASLGADFNSKVDKGQVIAQLDPTRFKANLEQTQASLKAAQAQVERNRVESEQAKRDHARGQALFEKQVIGAAELEALLAKRDATRVGLVAAQAQVAQARAAVGMARVDLERTTIRAPIAGTVLNRAVDVGQTVAASLQAPVLFTIAQDLTNMEVRAAIDEADVGKLKEGLEARFRVDAYPAEEFVAKIFMVRSQPNVQQNVVSYDAILRVDNPDGKLRPGMTANVRIISERRDSVPRVPNAALRFKPPTDLLVPSGEDEAKAGKGEEKRGGGRKGRTSARVYKPQGNKVTMVRFKPGISDDEFTEVLGDGLREGDEIILDGQGGAMSRSDSSAKGGAAPAKGRAPRFF
jgi:HlyD family secretion protein